MRRRLTLVAVVAALTAVISPPAGAQVPPPTHGELIEGGAQATAEYHQYDEGSGPAAVSPRGRNSNRTCDVGFFDGTTNVPDADVTALQGYHGAVGRDIQVVYSCRNIDDGGDPQAFDGLWPPSGNTEFLIPPADLMEQAREAIWFPPPRGITSPSLAEGVIAQLDAYFAVSNWEPVTARAQAGTIWAEVIAEPASQTWVIEDTFRGETYTVECDGPGVSFDPASGLEPPADACRWERPPHSSAGQTSYSAIAGAAQGEPCFPATVTVQWNVRWETNASSGGGPLEPGGESAASTCIVVKEVQAVVTGDPGD